MLDFTNFRVAILVILALPIVGCATEDEELSDVWGTTHQALEVGSDDVSASAETGSVDVDDVDFDLSCEDGGSLTLVGSMDQTIDSSGVSQTFDYDATFIECAQGDLTIDGDLQYSLEQIVEDDVIQRWSYSGTLIFSGEYDETCELDVTAEQVVTDSSASLTYAGTICGQDASLALHVSD